MQNVVVCVGLSIQQVCATVVRHYRAWTDKEIQTLQSGLQAEVRTNENYPRYIVLGGHHDLGHHSHYTWWRAASAHRHLPRVG